MEPTQNPEPRYPRRATSSRGLWNNSSVTLNFTKNEVLIPVPKHDQGTQCPSSLIAMEKAPEQTRIVTSEEIDFGLKEQVKRKRYRKRNFKKTTSIYRGVTRCKGRFESFVWDKDLRTTGKRGKTGGFKDELEAARAHDLIAIKIWGQFAYTNFPASFYVKEISEMQQMTLREYILRVRRGKTSTTATDGSNTSSAYAGTSPEVQENSVVNDALPNTESTTMQSMFDEIGEQSQAPTTLQNQHENVEENKYLYDDEYAWLDFDLTSPLWSCDFGSTQLEDHANALGNENPVGAGNGSVASFGSSSVEFHSMETNNIQQFEEQNPDVASVHRYEPLQRGFATNTQHENIVADKDWDITQYLNLDFPDMDD
ncbi:hypothetical protein VNO80_14392 [Phaseolus coccineus]|uniref:AP2/ERF domain-containing protein n=1 Tax=Phaseolus coccineus TaxID=3886 RepID=A0AAN9R1C4_PHACN